MADWVSIKAEYISTDISTRALAEKHGVSVSTLMKRSAAEKWGEEKKKLKSKIEEKWKRKIASVAASHEVDRITRLLSIGDKLADKLDEAAGQLDQKIVTHKRKTKTMEYGDQPVCRKPLKETTVEEEFLAFVEAPIDRQGLQQLTTALKNLNDVAKISEQSGNEESLSKARELLGGLPSAID